MRQNAVTRRADRALGKVPKLPMDTCLPVIVVAQDPISRAGIESQLRGRPDIRIAQDTHGGPVTVAIVVIDRVDEPAVQSIRCAQRRGPARVLVIATHITCNDLLVAAGAGCGGLLRRAEADTPRLAAAIHAVAAGKGTLPADLLGQLLDQVGHLQRHPLGPPAALFAGLTQRELQVLRLLADGQATTEIAAHLGYAERTVKGIIHDVTTRFHLRNRAHAVAYAVREGLI